MLRILESGKKSAKENMEKDSLLLGELGTDPILHLYDWQSKSGTYGYFINPEKHLKKSSVSFARRPTGGGIVFHIWDYAFSFLLPSSHPHFSDVPLENYQFVNQVVLDVMEEMFDLKNRTELIPESFPILGEDHQNFCMARPTKYDVVYQGTKIAGAAQRKTKKGYLHQGTISLCHPNESLLKEVLIHEKDLIEAMKAYTFAPIKPQELSSVRLEVKERLKVAFSERL